MGPGPDSGSSAPSSVPQSLVTSRDDEDDEDEESSDKRSNCHGGSRSKSNQRWMKLRTTVQLSSAMQKKPPLKREDSFLKRFSTRPIPESQETLDDTAECDGDGTDKNMGSRRGRRPRRLQKPPRSVVNPDEDFYYYWLMLVSFCVLYNLWTLIVRQSLPELQALAPGTWFALDCFTDFTFFLDILVQFRTGYLEQGLMVYNSRKLAGHYFKSKFFFLDLFSLLPLDLLQISFGSNPMLRFLRFLKLYRVYNYYYMVESRTIYPNFWRVLNLIHILLLLAHWFGCFYYLLSEAESFQGDWVYPHRPGEYATLTRKYLGSVYWSTLTLTTIGDLPTPETNAEITGHNPRRLARRGRLSRLLQFKHNGGYVFTIVSYLIGVFIFATIVGQVGNVITNRNANRLEFERLLDGAKTYMRHHKVPGGMKRRVLRWYDYSWSRGRIQGGGDINTALGLLPDKLKTELALHVNLTVLKKVTIFQECQPEFLRDLVLKMKAYIFTPGDSICRKGEVAREMFIIADGILEVISENGRILTTMKAGDFFGEIGILNLDGLNKRTADVRSVGYSELFSLSREDVLTAMTDYPEAQEILQNLGRKRLLEAQKLVRESFRSASPGHDSSDNSTGKRIVDKLKSDVKGLKNVLRKSRRNTRPEESLELQPLAPKVPTLKRQQKIDDGQDLSLSNTQEQPVSPLGAGLPLLSRLRLLKEKEEREERRNLMDTSTNTRILQLKTKNEQETTQIEREMPKESLLPKSTIPEETSTQSDEQSSSDGQSVAMTTVTTTSQVETRTVCKLIKPWTMLKNASLTPKDNSSQKSSPAKKLQQTKMYASVDDLSPEYCGLPFVKKLKILNERQKLAELEKAARSSSLDCGDNVESKFDSNLTRSHSETCAIEYTRKLAKYNQDRQESASPEQLSPENETLERQNLKSILKKLSASSRADSSETSATSTPDRDAELKKLMRAPTIEGYAARHSKLSKSVTFNKYTLQSPPSEQLLQSSKYRPLSSNQDQLSLPPPNKFSFRPVSSAGDVSIQTTSWPREECLDELLYGVGEVIKAGLEDVQDKFTSLELEIHKRDEIISQLQSHIQQLERKKLRRADDSGGDSTEHDASMEDDLDDDREDHPFMRDSSVDTVLGSRDRHSSSSVGSSSRSRRSWEEHSERETLELQELPNSIVPQKLLRKDVAIDLESNSDSRSDEDFNIGFSKSDSDDEDEEEEENDDEEEEDVDEDDDDDDDDKITRQDGYNNWEVTLLAKQLEARQRNGDNPNPGS
ncbi:PREDICTED: transcriptional regulator ATRX-like isoform X2 [Trachymyrmex septentrionalis]|uniref:transcriptional regulator ATRX-like isoform X2 n=1 Tax=Trachymyrmex septentrionalis TaxID=34720 RepID=UPI00084F25C0|nr:PREDICTED: transcriptional regulator ATRX-like isoform X2 [Trachymyrmex septentrionalis]